MRAGGGLPQSHSHRHGFSGRADRGTDSTGGRPRRGAAPVPLLLLPVLRTSLQPLHRKRLQKALQAGLPKSASYPTAQCHAGHIVSAQYMSVTCMHKLYICITRSDSENSLSPQAPLDSLGRSRALGRPGSAHPMVFSWYIPPFDCYLSPGILQGMTQRLVSEGEAKVGGVQAQAKGWRTRGVLDSAGRSCVAYASS